MKYVKWRAFPRTEIAFMQEIAERRTVSLLVIRESYNYLQIARAYLKSNIEY